MKQIGPYICESTGECQKKFGEELFGEFLAHHAYNWFDGYGEPNTPEEEVVLKAIKQWVKGENSMAVPPAAQKRILKIFKDLKKCSKHWPKILEPETTTLYRTVMMPASILEKDGLTEFFDSGTIKYKPFNLLESWTINLKQAERFLRDMTSSFEKSKFKGEIIIKRAGLKNEDAIFVPTILEAKFSEKELLFSSKFMNTISNFELDWYEYEVVRISNAPISAKATIRGEKIDHRK